METITSTASPQAALAGTTARAAGVTEADSPKARDDAAAAPPPVRSCSPPLPTAVGRILFTRLGTKLRLKIRCTRASRSPHLPPPTAQRAAGAFVAGIVANRDALFASITFVRDMPVATVKALLLEEAEGASASLYTEWLDRAQRHSPEGLKAFRELFHGRGAAAAAAVTPATPAAL